MVGSGKYEVLTEAPGRKPSLFGHGLQDLMSNLDSITTSQAAIIALFRVVNRHVGNLPPMPGVFPDYPAPAIRNTDLGTEMLTMRWGTPPTPRMGLRRSHDRYASNPTNCLTT